MLEKRGMNNSRVLEIHLAQWLVRSRESRGVSQEALATQLNKSQSTIAKIERGNRRVSVVELLEWFNALGIAFEDWIGELNEIYRLMPNNASLWEGSV